MTRPVPACVYAASSKMIWLRLRFSLPVVPQALHCLAHDEGEGRGARRPGPGCAAQTLRFARAKSQHDRDYNWRVHVMADQGPEQSGCSG